MSRERENIRRVLERYNCDKILCNEEEVRQYFGINSGMCVDGDGHEPGCKHILVEHTETGLRKAIKQMEVVTEALENRNYSIFETVLVIRTLRGIPQYKIDAEGYLIKYRGIRQVRETIRKKYFIRIERLKRRRRR